LGVAIRQIHRFSRSADVGDTVVKNKQNDEENRLVENDSQKNNNKMKGVDSWLDRELVIHAQGCTSAADLVLDSNRGKRGGECPIPY
jgi:hypothetical protein